MRNTYDEILKIWNNETPDDFAIFSEFYYQMFGEDFTIPYETDSTQSCFFPYNWLTEIMMKNYRVQVETNDGCVTIWYEKSKAKSAHTLINNRVYNQLCGLNIKEVSVTLSAWIMNYTLRTYRGRVTVASKVSQ